MLISLLLTQLAVDHDLTKSDLPVDTTSFCRAMFIDIADKQPITAQLNAMLTRPFFQDGCPRPLKISWTNNTVTKNEANVSDPEKHMFLHAFYDALCNIVHASAAAGLMTKMSGRKNWPPSCWELLPLSQFNG